MDPTSEVPESQQYWAALPPDEVVPELHKRVKNYYSHLEDTGHLQKIRKTYQMFNGLGQYDPTNITEGGEQGELLRIRINKLRSILNHILTIITQNRPALKAVAINGDVASLTGARLGETLIDYYMATRNFETLMKEATELALVTTRGYVVMDWDVTQGKEFGATAAGKVVYTGDVSARAKSALDVIHDIYADTPSWYIIIDRANKFDLAAQFPEKAQEIVDLSPEMFEEYDLPYMDSLENDVIYKYTFVHRKSPAMPNGRHVEFLDGDILLTDGPLPYKEMLVFPIQAGKVSGIDLGYTPAFDLLAAGDAMNSVFSSFITNIDTFGTNNVWTPPGSNLGVSQLAGGLNHIESDVKPESVNLAQMPGEMFKVYDMLDTITANLSGINQVVQGNPQASLRSGEALALVAAQAIQYNNGLQAAYINLSVRVGQGILWLLQDYATTPRLVAIVGQKNRSMAKLFEGSNLEGIDRVVMEPINALSKTTAGKLEIAKNLLQANLIKSPEEYLTVLETGRLDTMIDGSVSESLLIQQENELLRDGSLQVMAVLTEDHARHIKGHKDVLSDPYLKTDPAVVGRVLQHIQEHIDLGSSPAFQQLAPLFGVQPIAPMAPPPMAADPSQMMGPPGVPPEAGMPDQPQIPEGMPPEFQDAAQQLPQ